MVTQHKLLSQRVHLLTLLQSQVVRSHIVLVHLHQVLKELVAGSRCKQQLIGVVADVQTGSEHIALVTIHDGGGRVLYIKAVGLHRTFWSWLELAISETILVHVLIISSPVEGELLVWSIHQTQLSSCLVCQVVLLIEVLVIDKALQSAVETSHAECELLAWTMVVSNLYITI